MPQLAIHVIISVKFVLFTVTTGTPATRPRVGTKRARPIASGNPGNFIGTDFTDFTLLHSPNEVQPPPDPSDLLSHEQSGPRAQLMLAHMSGRGEMNSVLQAAANDPGYDYRSMYTARAEPLLKEFATVTDPSRALHVCAVCAEWAVQGATTVPLSDDRLRLLIAENSHVRHHAKLQKRGYGDVYNIM